MTDARVAAIAEHWTPRLLANGVDHNDLVRTLAAVESWAEWLPAWRRAADEHAAVSAGAAEAGRTRTAAEAALRAAIAYHVAKFNWPLGDPAAREATRCAAASLERALATLDPSAERVEAPLDDGRVVGTLRRPPASASAPLVVVVPGFDSAKEEFTAWEQTFLDRGLATLSLDGPGQGESALEMPLREDYERAVTAALDACARRGGVDVERVGLAGVSLGGLYAVRTAAFDDRVRAVAAISAPYDLGALWPDLRGLLRATFADRAGAPDEAAARALADRLSLDGIAERIDVPVLVVAGGRDRVIPWQETQRLADRLPSATWVLLDEGNHACNNLPNHYRPLVADWLAESLVSSPAAGRN